MKSGDVFSDEYDSDITDVTKNEWIWNQMKKIKS